MLTSFKNAYASCVSIPTNIQSACVAAEAALTKIANIIDIQNFTQDHKTLVSALTTLNGAVSEYTASALSGLCDTVIADLRDTYLNFVDPDHPITADGLSKCTASLPTDTLHQRSYLNPHLYATMMYDFGDKGFEITQYVEPRSCCMIAPEDMYVVSILKRTYGYVSELQEDSEMYGWMEAAFTILLSFSDYMKETISTHVSEMLRYYEDESFGENAASALSNPQMADVINHKTAEAIMFIGKIKRFAANMDSVLKMMDETADLLEETRETIHEAYELYCKEAFKITF